MNVSTQNLLQSLVLGVVALPLLAAAAVFLLGRRSPDAARRAALNGALLQLGLTALFCGAFYEALGYNRYPTQALKPLGVPGEPSDEASGADTYATEWDLLTFPAAGLAYGRGIAAPRVAAVQLFLGVDGLNVWLVGLSGVMNLVAVLASWRAVRDRAHAYYAWLFVLQSAMLGAFLSFDAVLFYVFFELTLIPAFFLIGHWGVGGGRRDAARKFFLYTFFGSLLTLTGILGVALTNPTPLDQSGRVMAIVTRSPTGSIEVPAVGPVTFSIPQLMANTQVWGTVRDARDNNAEVARREAEYDRDRARQRAAATPGDASLSSSAAAAEAEYERREAVAASAAAEARARRRVQTALFFLLMCGFAVKIPIFPFHTWLPAAYSEAPLPVTMVLSSTLAKLGTFGVLRLVLPLAPGPAAEYGLPVFGTLGAVGIVYGALCAFAQRDLKRVIAYSSISHLGLVVIALFAGTSEALAGASLHMVNHGLSTGVMFALLGFLHDRYKTTDGAQFSGLFGRFPAFGALFVVAALASVGVPAFNNFVSEMLMLGGLFRPVVTVPFGYGFAVAGAAGIFLSAWYTMTLVRRAFFGPERLPVTATPVPTRLTAAEWGAFGLPLVLCVVLGVRPQPALDAVRPDAVTMEYQAEQARLRGGIGPQSPPPGQPRRGAARGPGG